MSWKFNKQVRPSNVTHWKRRTILLWGGPPWLAIYSILSFCVLYWLFTLPLYYPMYCSLYPDVYYIVWSLCYDVYSIDCHLILNCTLLKIFLSCRVYSIDSHLVLLGKTLNNYVKLWEKRPVFPFLRSKEQIWRRLSKKLRRRAFGRLQLLEALPTNGHLFLAGTLSMLILPCCVLYSWSPCPAVYYIDGHLFILCTLFMVTVSCCVVYSWSPCSDVYSIDDHIVLPCTLLMVTLICCVL